MSLPDPSPQGGFAGAVLTAPVLLFRQGVSEHAQLFLVFEGNFQHSIDEIFVMEVHTGWAVKADQPGMDGDVGILSLRSRLVFWSPEIDRVLRDERPVSLKNDRSSSQSLSPPSFIQTI